MQVLKKVLVSLVMVASMAVVSSTAFAAPKGEAEVKAAIETTLTEISTAQAAAKAGDFSGASKSVLDAANASKEFRFEGTERQRQKATDLLKSARKSYQAGDTAAGYAALATAFEAFTEMKAKYDLTHK